MLGDRYGIRLGGFTKNGVLSRGPYARKVRGACTRMMEFTVVEDSKEMVGRGAKESEEVVGAMK